MIKDASVFTSCFAYIRTYKLHIVNGMGLHIQHIGFAMLNTLYKTHIHLNNILHIFTIIKNLLNVSKLLTNNDVLIEFHKTSCFVKDKRIWTILLKWIVGGGLY